MELLTCRCIAPDRGAQPTMSRPPAYPVRQVAHSRAPYGKTWDMLLEQRAVEILGVKPSKAGSRSLRFIVDTGSSPRRSNRSSITQTSRASISRAR